MKLRCPKCKSDDVVKISRNKYLLRGVACLSVILIWYPVFRSLLKEESDLDVMAELIISCILAAGALGAGIYLLIKAIRAKGATYYCGYCECHVDAPLQVERTQDFNTLDQIRRPQNR